MLARKATPWQVRQTEYIGQIKSGPGFLTLTVTQKSWVRVGLILLLLIGIAYAFRAQQVKAEYRLAHLQTEVVRLSNTNESLGLSVAELKSPSRIQTIAQKDLGMVLPETFVYSSSNASSIQKDVEMKKPIRDLRD